MSGIEKNSGSGSFDFSKIYQDLSRDNEPVSLNEHPNSKKSKFEIFIHVRGEVSSKKDEAELYDIHTFFHGKNVTHLGGDNGVIDSEKHTVVLLKKRKDGTHKIASKEDEVDILKGKRIVLYRTNANGVERREELKNRNIVFVELSNEQYERVFSAASRVFSDIARQAKENEKKKDIKEHSLYRDFGRAKRIQEDLLSPHFKKAIKDSDFHKHPEKDQSLDLELQQFAIEEEREIKRKEEKREKKFEQIMENEEAKEENREIIKEKNMKDEIKTEES